MAAPCRLGSIRKATLTAISNTRRGSGKNRGEEATAIQWTLWGKQAENAAQYLAKGSHVNVVGRVQNNNYEKDGETVYTMAFTAEEIDYLDAKAEGEALRAKQGPAPDEGNTVRRQSRPHPPKRRARKAARLPPLLHKRRSTSKANRSRSEPPAAEAHRASAFVSGRRSLDAKPTPSGCPTHSCVEQDVQKVETMRDGPAALLISHGIASYLAGLGLTDSPSRGATFALH